MYFDSEGSTFLCREFLRVSCSTCNAVLFWLEFLAVFEAESDYDGSGADYKKIHDQYKNLVDFMLGSYMEDIGITPEQFESACGKASKNIKSKFHQVR